MLFLKIIFGIIVTLPILLLAEFLFEKTVEDALVGTTAKKKRQPLYKRFMPKRNNDNKTKKKHKKHKFHLRKKKEETSEETSAQIDFDSAENTYNAEDTDNTENTYNAEDTDNTENTGYYG